VVLTAAQGHLIFLASRKLLQDKSLLIEKLKEEYNENVRINKLMVEQQRTAELGLMAGGIAHEIRNPLAVIRGQTELIQNITHTDKFGPEVILKKSESIRNATQRIATIIDGMSVLGRKSDLDAYVKCNVAEIASYLEATCGSQFLVKGIEFHVQIDKNLPEIECRKGQIAQILLNLINNATYELSQTEGRRWIVLEFKDAGEQIEASVLDSGGGVKLEDRDKIFQAFYTTKQLGQGTGLGLSISKAIAQDHGGSLTLDTQSQYTRFVLKLPKSQIQLAVA
jgi:signal transduction histidine kinase